MAKNDWKKNKEEPALAPLEDTQAPEMELATEAPVTPAEVPATPVAETATAALVDLGTYARLNVEGYKEHWWHSIERFARSHGLKSYKVSEAKAKEVLSAWGAKFK